MGRYQAGLGGSSGRVYQVNFPEIMGIAIVGRVVKGEIIGAVSRT